jgi:hypothetical protein
MNPRDIVKLDIPLFIRLLEYAREDAKDDMDLHDIAENIIRLSETGGVLSMKDYNAIVGSTEEDLAERRIMLVKAGIIK